MIKKFLLVCIFSIQYLTINGYICGSDSSVTQSPVIGVLAQEDWNHGKEPNNSFIVASYVKYLEMAGAQVVPILLKKDDSYYSNLFKKLNGLFLPGGMLLDDSIYMKTAKLLWAKATNNNINLDYDPSNKNFFPVWGTCLGFQFMFDFISGETSHLSKCDAMDTKDPVELTDTNENLRQNSKLLKKATFKLLDWLRNEEVTYNYHRRCMKMSDVTKYNLDKNIRILGTNEDKNGLKYVSIFESKYYPIYAVQFHPEKNVFEFLAQKSQKNVPHSFKSIFVSQYFANFFVSETRKNKNCFDSQEELNSYSINNYQPEFTAKNEKNRYIQKYYFPL